MTKKDNLMRNLNLSLFLIFLSVVCGRDCLRDLGDAPWRKVFSHLVPHSPRAHAPQFRLDSAQYLQMVALSYDGKEHEQKIQDWTLLASLRQEVGLNALIYMYNKDTNTRVYDEQQFASVVFRGSVSLSDFCADKLMFNLSSTELDCSMFSPSELDYRAQGIEFVKNTVSEMEVLFVGHSLGAGMAQFMGYTFGRPSLGFSSPGIRSMVEGEGRDDCVLQIAHPLDPIVEFTRENQRGFVCSWSVKDVPSLPDCIRCYQPQNEPDLDLAVCKACESETHPFKHYIEDISSLKVPKCIKLKMT